MNWFKLLSILFLAVARMTYSDYLNYEQHVDVAVYTLDTDPTIIEELNKKGIRYTEVKEIDSQKPYLYIFSDIENIKIENLPDYYIVVQEEFLQEEKINSEFIAKLKKAVAVWDRFQENINLYKDRVKNYYCLPVDYEYLDTVLLPCYLPLDNLGIYKQLLEASTDRDSDISSHLPVIFSHVALQKPTIIFELGVSSGQSSLAFYNAAKVSGAKLVGVDIDPQWKKVYEKFNDPICKFYGMDDIEFRRLYRSIPEYRNQKVDVIFIDTSHVYEHTVLELKTFYPLLSRGGSFIFHDTNMSPLENFGWYCLTDNVRYRGWDNEKGVVRALKEFFNIQFNESEYYHAKFSHLSKNWEIVHYPYCNGLTIVREVE